MNKLLKRILGDPQKSKLKAYEKRAEQVLHLEQNISALTDDELRAKTDYFKKKISGGSSLDSIMNEAYAVVREAAWRKLEMKHFKVQLIGGIAMQEGSVAEMRTGEGKTLVATLPLYLNALTGKGAHLVTVNDYLAQRDAGWMANVYDFLGLSTAVIVADNSYMFDPAFNNDEHDDERFAHFRPITRQEAYAADITYGTNNEYGFDYLRDNMVRQVDQLRQRELNFAIVDEVDSILIDEARTPLIISAPATSSGNSYSTFARVAKSLKPDDYELDEKRRSVIINDEGIAKVQGILGLENLYSPENVRMIYHLDQALRAQTLFKKDKDYVVSGDGEVVIVDEFTGRLMHGRRYNEGLHQAIEAKEGVEVLQESMTLATISFQNYFRLYGSLAGMTGTAETEAEEFYQIYKLDVVVIPTNKPSARIDRADRIYKTRKAKFRAIVAKVAELNKKGQPVLIGTSSIENNEALSMLLAKAGLEHQVLNAKHHEQEASIVAKAGQAGGITLATNIAGRGTDIVLGEGVVENGGLFVLGSERHESRRIDNQLRGRAGRQGDPGETQFYVSAEDDLMRIFGGERIASLMGRLGVDEDTPIEHKALSKSIESAQKKVESHNFDSRKQVVQYDDVMNRHRKAVYSLRQTILAQDDISEQINEMLEGQIATLEPGENDKSSDFAGEASATFNLSDDQVEELKKLSGSNFSNKLKVFVDKAYAERTKQFGDEPMRRVEREIYLQVLDNLWMQHLENMGHLREGINWRSVGQKDPLVEYRREGQVLFDALLDNMGNETFRAIMHAHPVDKADAPEPIETELTLAAKQSERTTESANKTKPAASTNSPARKALSEEDLKKQKRRKRENAKKKKQKRSKNRKKNK